MKLTFITYGIALCVYLVICAVFWPYTINTWLEFAAKDPSVVWWHGILIGIVPGVGQLALPAALLTWIFMLFV